MLQRKLIYTAVTRARSKVIIVGSRKALEYAINNTAAERKTLLVERLSS